MHVGDQLFGPLYATFAAGCHFSLGTVGIPQTSLSNSRGEGRAILSVFPALIVHSELKSVRPGFPVAFIF